MRRLRLKSRLFLSFAAVLRVIGQPVRFPFLPRSPAPRMDDLA
jgi:hypothetical protein